ncbi:phasin [Asticcacaulis sp. 201]|uniref:phasin n=1 Tax=Asticcacaulis sp. 201 TaxID=3028787 RepID=UPI0029160F0C|nr:phasin [Asticcacaulis sp. 201]MDV6332226.1 phasin [Asticcacaulis sp. 201]
MMSTPSAFEHGLRLMADQQQRAARSLINLIEMISTTSRRYAEDTTAFTQEALNLMNEAAQITKDGKRDPAAVADLQKKWADTCLKYGQDQTKATMHFVEQCGKQALTVAAHASETPTSTETPKE